MRRAKLQAPSEGKPVAGERHAGFSPDVSVIHDFLLKALNPFTLAGMPGAGLACQPLAHQFQSVELAPDALAPSLS